MNVHSCRTRRARFRLGQRHESRTANVLLLALSLAFAPAAPTFATDDFAPAQQFVKYDNDSVSLGFSNLRAVEAASLMRSSTGIAITLPPSTHNKLVTLRLQGAKIDQAVHSFLAALDVTNSFLVYDKGRLTGVVALESVARPSPVSETSGEDKRKTNHRELTVKEADSILRDIRRWSDLTAEEQKTIHARLKTIPPSRVRDQVIAEYVRRVLEVPEYSLVTDEDPPGKKD
jgi:hypothetical protein